MVSLASGTVARICSSPLRLWPVADGHHDVGAGCGQSGGEAEAEAVLEPVTTASFPDRSGTVAVSWRAMKITPCKWITEP